MGCSTQALKPDPQDPDLRSGSMWYHVKFDTAHSKQSCQIRIKAWPCLEAKWSAEIRIESGSQAPCGAPH